MPWEFIFVRERLVSTPPSPTRVFCIVPISSVTEPTHTAFVSRLAKSSLESVKLEFNSGYIYFVGIIEGVGLRSGGEKPGKYLGRDILDLRSSTVLERLESIKVSSSDGLYICFHLPLYFFRSSQAEILFKGLKPSTKREMDNFYVVCKVQIFFSSLTINSNTNPSVFSLEWSCHKPGTPVPRAQVLWSGIGRKENRWTVTSS